MVQLGSDISIRRQCGLLELARSALYDQASDSEAGVEELALMRRIDGIYLKHPYCGSRRMTIALGQEGHDINRKRVQRLIRILSKASRVLIPAGLIRNISHF
ncbi:MAG TPA: IS3 family transposase [Anaeromyxobacteraceae bacterium]|nr:IS3 family transposase [Anaeromyxobacteraceae bacterium]